MGILHFYFTLSLLCPTHSQTIHFPSLHLLYCPQNYLMRRMLVSKDDPVWPRSLGSHKILHQLASNVMSLCYYSHFTSLHSLSSSRPLPFTHLRHKLIYTVLPDVSLFTAVLFSSPVTCHVTGNRLSPQAQIQTGETGQGFFQWWQ